MLCSLESKHDYLPLSLTPLSLTVHTRVKAELKIYLCIITFHAMKMFKTGGTGS